MVQWRIIFWSTSSLMVIWCSTNMVKWRRNKFNGKMNYMVIFNFFLGYQLGISLFYFHPECQWWWYWQLWCISPVLYLYYAGIYSILSCHISVFSNVEVVQWCDDYWWCSNDDAAVLLLRSCTWLLLEWIPPPRKCLTGYLLGWFTGTFGCSGQLLVSQALSIY